MSVEGLTTSSYSADGYSVALRPRAEAWRIAAVEWRIVVAAFKELAASARSPRAWPRSSKQLAVAAAALLTTLAVGVLGGSPALNQRLHAKLGSELPRFPSAAPARQERTFSPPTATTGQANLRAALEQSPYFDAALQNTLKVGGQLKCIPHGTFAFSCRQDGQYSCLLFYLGDDDQADTEQFLITINTRGISCPALKIAPCSDVATFMAALLPKLAQRVLLPHPVQAWVGLQHVRKVARIDENVEKEVEWHLKHVTNRLIKSSTETHPFKDPVYQVLYDQNTHKLQVLTYQVEKETADASTGAWQAFVTRYNAIMQRRTGTATTRTSSTKLEGTTGYYRRFSLQWDPQQHFRGCHSSDGRYFDTFQDVLEHRLLKDQRKERYWALEQLQKQVGDPTVLCFSQTLNISQLHSKRFASFNNDPSELRVATCKRVLTLLENGKRHKELRLIPVHTELPISKQQMALAQAVLGMDRPMTLQEAFNHKQALLATLSPRSTKLDEGEHPAYHDICTVHAAVNNAWLVYDSYARQHLSRPDLLFDPHN